MKNMPFLAIVLCCAACQPSADPSLDSASFALSFTEEASSQALDGRLILILSKDDESEPRFQVRSGVNAVQIFGMDAEGLAPGEAVALDGSVFGYPYDSLRKLPPGKYFVQALLHKYDTFTLSNGKTVRLPMDQGEGQQWARSPGNIYSEPRMIQVGPGTVRIPVVLNKVIEPIEPPADTDFVKHVQIRSELLSNFWGQDIYVGAHVLLPAGFAEHPEARYPLMVFHGHFPDDLSGFRTEPPDENLECEPSERFHLDCYNRTVQQEAWDFYKQWNSPDFPRMLIIEIQHANPYYDDSYAVNSANLGPYGDALTYELIPYIEKQFRGLGEGWARFTYGGSTGGWEAAAVQIFYPDEYNGAFAACPDPVDFRAYVSVNLYEDDNAYYDEGPFQRVPRPEHRDYLGHISVFMEDEGHKELVLGTRGRSGGQYDIWEAVFSPMDEDGYPQRIWDKKTGAIDHTVAEYWKEHYDLRYILERDWATLGAKLEGKLHIYAGDMDSYYLNNAVYLAEEFLEKTENPYYGGEVDYGDRAEHCWNGDQENPNAVSRLRYNTMYVPKILERILTTAPEGADLSSWRY